MTRPAKLVGRLVATTRGHWFSHAPSPSRLRRRTSPPTPIADGSTDRRVVRAALRLHPTTHPSRDLPDAMIANHARRDVGAAVAESVVWASEYQLNPYNHYGWRVRRLNREVHFHLSGYGFSRPSVRQRVEGRGKPSPARQRMESRGQLRAARQWNGRPMAVGEIAARRRQAEVRRVAQRTVVMAFARRRRRLSCD